MNVINKAARFFPVIAVGSIAVLAIAFISLGTDGQGSEAQSEFPERAPGQIAEQSQEPALEFSSSQAVGFATARSNLKRDLEEAPFAPHVAQYVPGGLALERYNLVVSGDEATLDLVYTVPAGPDGDWRPQVHVWQTSRPYDIPDEPAQSSDQEGSISIDGQSWRYWLLSYPQPDGRVLQVYDAETTIPGGISFAVDIRVGLDPSPTEREEAFAELEKVLGSLAPLAQQ